MVRGNWYSVSKSSEKARYANLWRVCLEMLCEVECLHIEHFAVNMPRIVAYLNFEVCRVLELLSETVAVC